jgi:O-antigen ligase
MMDISIEKTIINTQMNFNLDKTYQYLLIALAFVFPLTVVGGNLIIGIIVLLWMLSGNYQAKFNQIMSNKLAVFSILFFSTHVVGLLWTENMEWGLLIVNKMWYFLLLLPILLTITKKEYIRHYISAFILAMTLTELLSYLVWFEVIGPLHKATAGNPTPTMSHISYNPFLTFGVYLIAHEILFNKHLAKLSKYVYVFFVVTMSINMFITGGRAGQVMYFVMLSILIFQYYGRGRKVRATIISLIIIPSIFLGAYNSSDIFQHRMSKAVENISMYIYDENKNTSVGQRMTYTVNSLEIIKNNLFFGVGTGDFPSEYNKIHAKNTPGVNTTVNPHNMYILVAVQLGLFGLLGMLLIFYQQIKFSLSAKIKINRDLGLVLPLLFLVIMFSDSYLLGHYTTLLFIFFSSFLYKDFENS